MPNGEKNTGAKAGSSAATLPFEEALQQLESIVEAMEGHELPLEALLEKFEHGTRLAKVCQERLAQAEMRIEQLEKNSAGELSTKPLSELSEED